MEQPDIELARRAADGDAGAFHALMDRHAQDLFRLARSLSKTTQDAEDIVQEVFVAAYRGIGKFNGNASLRTWLSGILVRQAAKSWHKNRHSRAAVALDAVGESHRDGRRNAVSSGAAAVDYRLDLTAVLPKLAPEHREVLVLREVQGLSYAQIGQTLKIPQGTVESRIHRARNELRELLKEYRD
ncbi:MAG: rpoE [Phycisphaerales bacterium]|nr:rpoE [Phycisphaerales bacterium]